MPAVLRKAQGAWPRRVRVVSPPVSTRPPALRREPTAKPAGTGTSIAIAASRDARAEPSNRVALTPAPRCRPLGANLWGGRHQFRGSATIWNPPPPLSTPGLPALVAPLSSPPSNKVACVCPTRSGAAAPRNPLKQRGEGTGLDLAATIAPTLCYAGLGDRRWPCRATCAVRALSHETVFSSRPRPLPAEVSSSSNRRRDFGGPSHLPQLPRAATCGRSSNEWHLVLANAFEDIEFGLSS